MYISIGNNANSKSINDNKGKLICNFVFLVDIGNLVKIKIYLNLFLRFKWAPETHGRSWAYHTPEAKAVGDIWIFVTYKLVENRYIEKKINKNEL